MTSVLGGFTDASWGNAFTGNTLNLKSIISVKNVSNFEYYNFHLPENLVAGRVMLEVKGEAVNLKGTTVEILIQGNTKLMTGDKLDLICSPSGIMGTPKNKNCQVQQGGMLYEFSIYTDKNHLSAEVTRVRNTTK